MSYIGGPLLSTQEEDKEREERSEKSINLVTQSLKSLLPDLTDPKETAEYFTELSAEIVKPRVPAKSVAIFAGKRLMADLPVVRRAVSAGKEIITPVIQKTKTFLEEDYLEPVYAGIEDMSGGLLARASRDGIENKPLVSNMFASKTSVSPHLDNQGVLRKTFTNEADRRFNRVQYMNKRTIKTFKTKAGNQFKSLSNKLDEAYKHYEKGGNLKGLEGGTKWTNPETGETFLIKNKAAAGERVKLGIDSLESVVATKALREASATITLDDVIREAAGTGLSKELAIKYFNIAKSGKKDLTKLIYKLNKKAGRKLWSLGHGRAVKALRDAGSGHADMLSNIELEPLINVVDDFGNVLVRGNSGRGAVDELPDALNTALNRSRNLREELLKFSDKDLGDFWPKMGPITDEASFLTEAAKRDAFVEKVLEVSKSTKTVEEAVDLVLDAAGIMRTKGASTFPDASIYKNMKITF